MGGGMCLLDLPDVSGFVLSCTPCLCDLCVVPVPLQAGAGAGGRQRKSRWHGRPGAASKGKGVEKKAAGVRRVRDQGLGCAGSRTPGCTGFRVQGSGFRVQDVHGPGCAGFRVQCVLGSGAKVHTTCGVPGSGSKVYRGCRGVSGGKLKGTESPRSRVFSMWCAGTGVRGGRRNGAGLLAVRERSRWLAAWLAGWPPHRSLLSIFPSIPFNIAALDSHSPVT